MPGALSNGLWIFLTILGLSSAGRVRNGLASAPTTLGSVGGSNMNLVASETNIHTFALYSCTIDAPTPSTTYTWEITNAQLDTLAIPTDRDTTMQLSFTVVDAAKSPPTVLLQTDLQLAAAQFSAVYLAAYSPNNRDVNDGLTWTSIYGPVPANKMLLYSTSGKWLFFDASSTTLASGLGTYILQASVSDGTNSVAAQILVEFKISSLFCSSTALGLLTSCAADGSTGPSCSGTSDCASCAAEASCVGRQSNTITAAPFDSPLQCVEAGLGTAIFFPTALADTTAAGRTAQTGAMTPDFFGAIQQTMSQSDRLLSWTSQVSPPIDFPPGLAAVPLQVSGGISGRSTAQFVRFLVKDGSNFPAPGVISSITPSVAVADRSTNILVAAANLKSTLGLQCSFQLSGQAKVVEVSGTLGAGGVNCNLPKRTDLTDNGLDVPTTGLTVGISNYGPCGATTWRYDSTQLNFLNACPSGMYLNAALTGCDPCPAGKYNEFQGKTSAADCIGCPAGKFGSSPGESSSTCSGDCPAGYYCPYGTGPSQPKCADGFFGNLAQTSPSCSGQCAAGYFCKAGSLLQTRPDPPSQKCNAGRFGTAGQTGPACSGDCEVGYYCPAGTSQSNMQTQPCGDDASRCTAASPATSPNREQAYCGWGSGQASCAGPGYYTYGASSSSDDTGTRGLRGGAWAGRYAPGDGRIYPCPAGRYGQESYLSSPSCTGPCLAGYRCEEYSTYSTSKKCLEGLPAPHATNPTAYYCVEGTTGTTGSNPPKSVDEGYYSTPEYGDVLARSSQSQCNSREFCNQVNGKRYAKIEFRGSQLATNYKTRGATWFPQDTARLPENNAGGAVLVQADVRTNVVGAQLSFRLEVIRAENNRGEPTTECADGLAISPGLFQLSAPAVALAGSWHSVTVSTAQAHNFERCALIELRLVASIDESGAEYSVYGTINYIVQNANDPVSFQTPLIERAIDELSPQGTSAGQGISLTSSQTELASSTLYEVFDEDAFQGMNFTIESGNDDDLWLMLSCSGQVKAKQQDITRLDYETKSTYSLEIQVCDDGRPDDNVLCDSSSMSIDLSDVNEPPVFIGPQFVLSLPEKAPPNTQLTPATPPASDPDIPTAASSKASVYSVVDGGGILQTDGASYTSLDELNFEQFLSTGATSVPVTLQVCDTMPVVPACSSQLFQVSILDTNDAPEADDTVFSVPENQMPGAFIGSFESLDEDTGAIHAIAIVNWWVGELEAPSTVLPHFRPVQQVPGEVPFEFRAPRSASLAVDASPVLNSRWLFDLHWKTSASMASMDFENVAVYTLQVEVVDGGHTPPPGQEAVPLASLAPQSVVRNITVQLQDVNEPPILTPTLFSILENQAAGTVVSGNGTNTAGVGDGIIAADQDIGPGGLNAEAPFPQTFIFTVLNTGLSVPFTIDATTGSISTTAALNFEAAQSYLLEIKVEDVPASGAAQAAFQTVKVQVLNENESPAIEGSQSFDIDENSAPSTLVGDIAYSDEDILSTAGGLEELTFSIVGVSTQFFIDSTTGSLFVQQSAESAPHGNTLNYELSTQGSLLIQIQDKAGASNTQTVLIHVLNVNEPPIPTSGDLQFSDLTAPYTIGSLGAIDMESPGPALVFAWLSITAKGLLSQATCDSFFPAAAVSAAGSVTMQAGSPTTNINTDPSQPHICMLEYSVSDGTLSATHNISIFARPFNLPPSVDDENVVVPESFDPSTPIVPSFNWTDPNSEQLSSCTWSIPAVTPVEGRSKFRVDRTSGALFLKTAINFENAALQSAGGKYTVTVRVTDPLGAFADSTVEVTVTDVNEAPFVDLNIVFDCTEQSTEGQVVATLAVLDEDTADSHTWALTARNPVDQPKFPFVINLLTGVISVSAASLSGTSVSEALDFESGWFGQVEATVTVADNSAIGASISISVDIVIPVSDVNEPPVITQASNSSLPESQLQPGTLVTYFRAVDPDRFASNSSWYNTAFSISDFGNSGSGFLQVDPATNALMVVSELDHEAQEFHKFTVEVSDGAGLSDQKFVELHVLNSNDLKVTSVAVAETNRSTHQLFTNGSDTLLVFGENLGYLDGRIAKFLLETTCAADRQPCIPEQYTQCLQPNAFDNSHLECGVPPGFGTGLTAILRVELLDSTIDTLQLAEKLGYIAPQLDDVLGADSMITRGGEAITIRGQNFGPAHVSQDLWLTVTYSRKSVSSLATDQMYTATGCQITVNHTEILCQSVAGVGGGLYWKIEVGQQESEPGNMLTSYARPIVLGVVLAEERSIAAEACDSSLLNARDGGLLSTAGGEVIKITGKNLGAGAAGRLEVVYGRALNATLTAVLYAASGCYVSSDHDEVQCFTAPGSGAEHSWKITVAGLESDVTNSNTTITHYRPPQLHGVQASGSQPFVAPTDLLTEGGNFVYIRGDQFGPLLPGTRAASAVSVRYGTAADPARYLASQCVLQATTKFTDQISGSIATQNSLGTIRCATAPGVGKGLFFSLTVDGQVDVCTQIGQRHSSEAAYRPPAVRIYKGPGATLAETPGAQEILIEGGQFGPMDDKNDIEEAVYFNSQQMIDYKAVLQLVDEQYNGSIALYQQTTGKQTPKAPVIMAAVNCTISKPHIEIRCYTDEGAGKDLEWAVRIAGQVSTSAQSHVDPPRIFGISNAGAQSAEQEYVTVFGINFGPGPFSDSGDFLDWVTFGIDKQGAQSSDYTPSCVVEVPHQELRCKLPIGWSPPGASTDARLRYTFHTSVRGQNDLKPQDQAPALRQDSWYYGQPVLNRLEQHNDVRVVSGIAGIEPYTSALKNNQPGSPELFRIVGQNLGISDSRVSLAVHIQGKAVSFAETFSARNPFTNAMEDVLVVRVPVGHGQNVSVQVFATHALFLDEQFEILPIATPLVYSYRQPQLGVIDSNTDDVTKPGFSDVLPFFSDTTMTVVEMQGTSLGHAQTWPSLNSAQLVADDADGSALVYDNISDWRWGPNLDNLAPLRKNDLHAPSAHVWQRSGPKSPVSAGWVWTTSATVIQYYEQRNRHDYIVSAQDLDAIHGFDNHPLGTNVRVAPLPRQHIASWTHSKVQLRMFQEEASVMLCSHETHISTETCTLLTPFEAVKVTYGKGNGCPVIKGATAADSMGFLANQQQEYLLEVTAEVSDESSSTVMATKICEDKQLNIRFLFESAVGVAEIARVASPGSSAADAPLPGSPICRIFFRPPPGVGYDITYHMAIGLVYDSSSSCTMDFSFPKILSASTLVTQDGAASGTQRNVSFSLENGEPRFVEKFSPTVKVGDAPDPSVERSELVEYKALHGCDSTADLREDIYLTSCGLAHLNIRMPTVGGILTLHGRNFGHFPWKGDMTETNKDSENQFGQLISLQRGSAPPRLISKMTEMFFYRGIAQYLGGDATSVGVVVSEGGGNFQSQLAMRVGGQELKQLITFSYEGPTVLSVSPSLGNTTGGQVIVVEGINFGVDASLIRAFIGGRECTDIVLIESHKKLQMTSPVGEGRNLTVEVLVDGNSCGSRCKALFSYLPPELSGISQRTLGTDGTQTISLTGWNFGLSGAERQGLHFTPATRSPMIQLVSSSGERKYTVPDPIDWLDGMPDQKPFNLRHGGRIELAHHTLLKFRAPIGQGGPRKVILHVAGQSSINSLEISFELPLVSSVAPDSTPTRGHLIQFEGTNLGRFEEDFPEAINALLEAKTNPAPNTNENIDMQVSSSGPDNGLNVSIVLPGTSLTEPCRPVRANTQSPQLSPSSRYQQHISNWIKADQKVFSVASSDWEAYSSSYNHSHFFCVMPAGFGANVTAVYSMKGAPPHFQRSLLFNYNEPFITRATPNTINAAGMDSLGISGEDFGSENGQFGTETNEFVLRIGGANCTLTNFINSRNIECSVSKGTIGIKTLTLSAAGYSNVTFPSCAADGGAGCCSSSSDGNCMNTSPEMSEPSLQVNDSMLVSGDTTASTRMLAQHVHLWPELSRLDDSSEMFVSVSRPRKGMPAFIRVFSVQGNDKKAADVARLLNEVQPQLGQQWLDGRVSTEEAGAIYSQRVQWLGDAQGRKLQENAADIESLGLLFDLEMTHSRDSFNKHFKLRMVCDAEQYGQNGEYCEACPDGAVCLSSADEGCLEWSSDPVVACVKFVEPFSKATWWSDSVKTTDEFCHGPRKAGANDLFPLTGRPAGYEELCPRMLPCEPPDACLGNNTCKYGYDGFRCKDCLKGKFYRVGGECIECPSHAWVLILVAVLVLLAICAGGYILNRKKMHLAFISIGVDYMQVLAIFARSKVQWPAFIRQVFRWMSMFNLNIEITAPECTVPDMSYAMKWSAIQLLPLAISGILVATYVAVLVYNVKIKGKRGSASREHGTTLLAVFTLMFYYMYLLLTRTTFDVFNCQPTDPHDGYEPGYMEAVFEPCYKPGGMHMQLLAPAIIAMVIYVVGYPVLVMYCLYKFRFQIKADQILRAMDLGDTPTNPFYKIRRVLHKLYYHFIPDKHYWILLIIFRKFCIALTSLMFRRTPSFQMALCFCVLFFSYAMHAQHVPYMSMASRRQIVLLHRTRIKAEKKMARKERIHTRIGEQIGKCVADAAKERKRQRTNISDILSAAKMPGSDYLFSYNTMEAVLLACGCFVCLAGIMFQTGDDSNPIYAAQREALTVIVVLVVFGSLTYFFTVFGTEVMVAFGILQGPPQGRRGAFMFLAGVLVCYTGVGAPCGAALCAWSTKRPKSDDKLSVKKMNKSIDDAIDEGGENTGVGLNPLAMRAAAGIGDAGNIDSLLRSQFAPNAQQWLLIKEFSKQQHQSFQRLQDELAELNASKQAKPRVPAVAPATSADGTMSMSNPMARKR